MHGPVVTSRHMLFALATGFLCAALPASAGSDTIVAAQPTDKLLGWTGASVAVGWSQERAFHEVTISALLGNGGGPAAGRAYLMRSVGPGTTRADEVAKRYYDLPPDFTGMVPLFSGLDLGPGRYWLVLWNRGGGRSSYANVGVASPLSLSLAPGSRYLGSLGGTSDEAEYPPGSKFAETVASCETMECLARYGFVFSVTIGSAAGELPSGVVVTADEVKPANGNFLLNPTFDSGVNDWAGPAAWDPRHDASGNPHSGSLKLSSRNWPPHACPTEEQCFAVSPGTYQLSAKVLVLTGDPSPPSNASAGIFFSFYTGDSCTQGLLKTSDHMEISLRGQSAWTTITTGPLAAPQDTRSVGVVLLACSARDVIEADFDDLVFQRVLPATNPPS